MADSSVRRRLTAQLLAEPADRSRPVTDVVDRLLAVQAQDERGFRLAVRSRSMGHVAADVDRALSADRTLVVSWLNRGTLHLVSAADYWWLHPLTTPQLRPANDRRLRQEGVTPQQASRGVTVVSEALAADGPLTRADLRRRLDQAGVPTGGQALVQVLLAAAIRGDIVRGPVVGTEHAFVSVAAWLGQRPPPLARADALARLALRYLAGHGPATAQDLARWAGVAVADAHLALESAGAGVTVGPRGLADLAGERPALAPPRPRLLGPFDPLWHGWADRTPFVGPYRQVVTVNGIFRPTVLVAGRVVGTWRLSGGQVRLDLFEPVSSRARRELDAEADDVVRFLA